MLLEKVTAFVNCCIAALGNMFGIWLGIIVALGICCWGVQFVIWFGIWLTVELGPWVWHNTAMAWVAMVRQSCRFVTCVCRLEHCILISRTLSSLTAGLLQPIGGNLLVATLKQPISPPWGVWGVETGVEVGVNFPTCFHRALMASSCTCRSLLSFSRASSAFFNFTVNFFIVSVFSLCFLTNKQKFILTKWKGSRIFRRRTVRCKDS